MIFIFFLYFFFIVMGQFLRDRRYVSRVLSLVEFRQNDLVPSHFIFLSAWNQCMQIFKFMVFRRLTPAFHRGNFSLFPSPHLPEKIGTPPFIGSEISSLGLMSSDILHPIPHIPRYAEINVQCNAKWQPLFIPFS